MYNKLIITEYYFTYNNTNTIFFAICKEVCYNKVLGEKMSFKPRLTVQDHLLIKEMALRGEKLDVIAKSVSTPVSRQRIKQITQKLNIDSFFIRQKQQEKEHTEKMFKKWGSQWDNKVHRKSLIYQIMREKFRAKKANAVRTGIEFTIDFGELTFPTHCPILGTELDYFSEQRTENTVSFDKINPLKGYVTGNVVIISWRANRIKNDGTLKEHQKIVEFLKSIL